MTFGNFLSPNITTWPFDKRKADDENERRDRAEEHGEGVWPRAHRQQLSVCASQRAPFIINNLPAPWSTDPCGQRETGLAGKLGKKRASRHPSLPEIGLPSLTILKAKLISLHKSVLWQYFPYFSIDIFCLKVHTSFMETILKKKLELCMDEFCGFSVCLNTVQWRHMVSHKITKLCFF